MTAQSEILSGKRLRNVVEQPLLPRGRPKGLSLPRLDGLFKQGLSLPRLDQKLAKRLFDVA